MAHFVKIDNKDDFIWLRNFVQMWAQRCNDNISCYIEHVDKFNRLAEAFATAKEADAVQILKTAKPVKEEAKSKPKREPVILPKLCKDHPTYGAKRRPTRECDGCWKAYEKFNGKYAAQQAKRKFLRSRGTT